MTMTYLAVPIAAQNLDQAKRQIKAARAAGAEMLELRTDYLENLSVELVTNLIAQAKTTRRARPLPTIVTCRDSRQGGAIAYPQQLRINVLTNALKVGAEFIDFEYENFFSAENQERIQVALSENSKARLIMSAHNFETKFTNIGKLYRHIETLYPAAIPKLVYTANHINDCFEAFDLLHSTGGERIIFCMGAAGLVSRIIAKKLNTLLTFAKLAEETATAPGQLSIKQYKTIYRWDCTNADTELYGIIGSPVAHSLSPAVHNACFADIGVNKLYLPLLVDGGKKAFDQFMCNILARGWLGFRGFSVTIPHKANALDYVRENQGFVEPLAEKISAVNTLLIGSDGKLRAYNTDYTGALEAIKSGLGRGKTRLKDLPVAVIGAGGAARAIVAGLTDAGAKIKIYNRTVERGEKLAADFNCGFAPLDDLPNVKAKLLINCTSIGMKRTEDKGQKSENRRQKAEGRRLKTNHEPRITSPETPIPKECLKKDMVVFDAVYNPAETLLLKQAKQAGAKTIDGLSMFINQAAAQFKLFTGKKADPKLMRKIIFEKLSR